ncbi:hypothetical protein Bbelb_320860 [Branchiostoma belcheri]|nr:hypothetical protein Bbelb_361280 [Branchiostoma belcheri]KAI8490348.1 hypothetical protein Bbelb_320860 [Branchiostoma belcheri]
MSSDSLSTSADAQENNQLAPCTLARTTFAPLSTVPSVNSLVQALDEDGVWSNGTVKTIHSDGTITVKFDGWRNQFNNRVNSTYVRQRIESPEVTKRRRSAKYKVDVTKIIAEDTVWFSEEGGGEVKSGTVVWVDPFTESLALQTVAQPSEEEDSLCTPTTVLFNQLEPKPAQNTVKTKRRPPTTAPVRAKKRRVTDATAQTENEPISPEASGEAETLSSCESQQTTTLQQSTLRELDQHLREDGVLLCCGEVYSLGQVPFLLIKLAYNADETVTATLWKCKADAEVLTGVEEDCTLICNARHLDRHSGKSFSRQFALVRKKTSQEALNRAVDCSIKNAGDSAYQSLLRKNSIGICIRRETESLSKNGRRKTFKIGPVQLSVDKDLIGMDQTFCRKFNIGTEGDFARIDKIAGAQWDVRKPNTTDNSAHYLVVTSACIRLDKTKCLVCSLDYINSGRPFTNNYRQEIATMTLPSDRSEL